MLADTCSTLGQDVGWQSTNLLVTFGLQLQSIGRYFAEGSSAYHQHLANVTADTLVEMLVDMSVDASVEWQSSIGCISVKTWLVLDRYSLSVDSWLVPMDCRFIYSYSNCWLIHNQYLTDSHSTVHRYTGNTLPMLSWPTVSRFCWLILDRELNITRPTYRPTVGDTNKKLSTHTPPIPHQYLTKDSPIHCRLATDAICWLTLDRQENDSQPRCWSILTWSTVYQLSADISVEIQLSIDWHSSRYIDQQSTQMLADTSIDIPPNDTWSLTCLSCMFLFSQWRSQGSWVTSFVFS